MAIANENRFDWDACEGCKVMLYPGDKIFRYADGINVCEWCAPTWKEAKAGFERDAFENPDNWHHFQQRLRVHLANGGALTAKCTETL